MDGMTQFAPHQLRKGGGQRSIVQRISLGAMLSVADIRHSERDRCDMDQKQSRFQAMRGGTEIGKEFGHAICCLCPRTGIYFAGGSQFCSKHKEQAQVVMWNYQKKRERA